MSIMRWDPFDELGTLRRSMDRLFDEFFTTRRPGTPRELAAMEWEPAVEMYETGRYLTVTGQHLEDTPTTIEQRQAAVDELHAEVFAEPKVSPNGTYRHQPYHVVKPPSAMSDDDLLARIRASDQGEKFDRLFARGDRSGRPRSMPYSPQAPSATRSRPRGSRRSRRQRPSPIHRVRSAPHTLAGSRTVAPFRW